MSTNKQRRESERQRLQRQLEERREREVSRRRNTTIASVVGALVVIAAVVVVVIVSTSGGDKKPTASKPSTTPTAPASDAATACGQKQFPTKTYAAAKGAAVTFDGVTVSGATDLTGNPAVKSRGTTTPTKLAYKDLVVGTGAAASATSCVDVMYTGVQYKNGKQFDSSWSRAQLGGAGQVTEFPLTGVVAGFTQGIGGTTGVPPMRIGGRRLIVLPAALGYPNGQPQAGIAANTPLVFLVDLVGIRATSS